MFKSVENVLGMSPQGPFDFCQNVSRPITPVFFKAENNNSSLKTYLVGIFSRDEGSVLMGSPTETSDDLLSELTESSLQRREDEDSVLMGSPTGNSKDIVLEETNYSFRRGEDEDAVLMGSPTNSIEDEVSSKSFKESVKVQALCQKILPRKGCLKPLSTFDVRKSVLTQLPKDEESTSLFELYEVFDQASVDQKVKMMPSLLKYKSFLQALNRNLLLCFSKVEASSLSENREKNVEDFFSSLLRLENLSEEAIWVFFKDIAFKRGVISSEPEILQNGIRRGLTEREVISLYSAVLNSGIDVDINALLDKTPINHLMVTFPLYFGHYDSSLSSFLEWCIQTIDAHSEPFVKIRLSRCFFSTLFKSENIERFSKENLEEFYSLQMSKECKVLFASYLLKHKDFQAISVAHFWFFLSALYLKDHELDRENIAAFIETCLNHKVMESVSSDLLINLIKVDCSRNYFSKQQLKRLSYLFNMQIDPSTESIKMCYFYEVFMSHPVWERAALSEIQKFIFSNEEVDSVKTLI